MTRQQATEGLSRESAEYKAAVTGGRKPLHRRDAALSGTTLPVDPAFDIAPPETSGVPPSMMRSYKGFQGAYGERHLSPVQYDRSTAIPLPGENLDDYTDRIDRILDEGRPKWIKALRDAPGTATQWGHDVAADAAELYLNINGVYREKHPAMVGVARSTAGLVGGMATDPVTYVLGGTGSIAGNVGRRLMATGFSIYSGTGAYEEARQLHEIWNRSDISYEQKVEMSTGLALNVAMGLLSARHGLRSPRTIPLEKGFANEISALGKNAQRDILSRFQEKFNAAVAEKLGERLQRQESEAQGSGSAIAQRSEELRFKPGDGVILSDGRGAAIVDVFPPLERARVQTGPGEFRSVRLSELQQARPSHLITKPLPSKQQAISLKNTVPRRPVPEDSPAKVFQRQVCGPEEFWIEGGGEHIWADGLVAENALLQEVKHIEKPRISPYIKSSAIRADVRRYMTAQTETQFRKYGVIIADPHTSFRALEVITNNPRAVPYLLELMERYSVPGWIVVKLKD